jgi:hypothetical protein
MQISAVNLEQLSGFGDRAFSQRQNRLNVLAFHLPLQNCATNSVNSAMISSRRSRNGAMVKRTTFSR